MGLRHRRLVPISASSAIGRTSTPAGIRSRSTLVPTMCQSPTESARRRRRAEPHRDQHLVGHQPPPARVGGRVRGQAVAVIVDAADPLHVGRDQDVHAAVPRASSNFTMRRIDFALARRTKARVKGGKIAFDFAVPSQSSSKETGRRPRPRARGVGAPGAPLSLCADRLSTIRLGASASTTSNLVQSWELGPFRALPPWRRRPPSAPRTTNR